MDSLKRTEDKIAERKYHLNRIIDSAADFIWKNARLLDRARFAYPIYYPQVEFSR